MSDQVGGMVRDSDIKFQCRLLLSMVQLIQLPKEIENALIQPIHEIVKIENNRLDKLLEDTDKEKEK